MGIIHPLGIGAHCYVVASDWDVRGNGGMSQSNIILGSILFGFFLYVTVRGQLPVFMGIITGNKQGTA